MERIAVVAVTYNRPQSLLRLLRSINSAYYCGDQVDLIISIDKSEIEDKIVELANNFNWKYGEKMIRQFSERQGLRKHILQCGDLVSGYDAVIIFEDDIIAAENYYLYTKQALQYYSEDPRIAGISLYSPATNEMVGKPFIPLVNDSDVFFIKSAQSWGQCWSKSMWESFRKWYKNNNGNLIQDSDMPLGIYRWSDSSWKKYYMKYIVETNKYFVYPYIALSSNASETGEHRKRPTSRYQVPLLKGTKNYKFVSLNKGIKYDVFFECEGLSKYILKEYIDDSNLCIDLYGTKLSNAGKRYILTVKEMDYDLLSTYGLKMRPHEANIIYNVEGQDIFLYDLKTTKNISLEGRVDYKTILSYYTTFSWKEALSYGLYGFKDALLRKVFKRK